MSHNQIIEAWNTQADGQNQWGALGEDEKVEFAFAIGAAESKAEIERLKAEAGLFAKHTGLTLAAKDTLLRQALEAMQWEVGGEPLPTLMMESIAAIKTHLGEQK